MNKLINTAALALTLVAGAQAHALGVSVSLSGSTSNAAASDSTTTNTNISTTVALDTASLLETGETTLNTAETSGQMVVARVEATADMATEMAGVAVATADNFVFGTTQNVQIGADGTMTAVIVLNK